MKKYVYFLLVLFLVGCLRTVQYHKTNQIKDGKYDSEYPSQPVSEHLEKIAQSVKMVSVLAYFSNFSFTAESKVTKKMVIDDEFESKADQQYYLNQPATGTATVVYYQNRRVGLITCAHILDFPDTVYSYYQNGSGDPTEFLSSVTIKTRQANNVIELPDIDNFEIIALDNETDLAFIGKDLEINPSFPIPVFNFKIGSAEELQWGSHVYLFGYPRGKKMISSCIVSKPGEKTFLIDAALPRGISGGLILATRDGAPNFEFVGLANAISAEKKQYLAPKRLIDQSEYDVQLPYTEEAYIKLHEEIYYGVTHAISVEMILEFLRKNETKFRTKGYFPDKMFF
jgi:trypsin-like peptidase